VATALVAFAIVALVLVLVVIVAADRGPGPADVAIAYELAWDRLDFDALWSLSGPELRDGRSKREFVAAKREAYEGKQSLAGLVRHVALEELESGAEVAFALTRVDLRDGTTVRNRLRLELHGDRWLVASYELLPQRPASPTGG
jgi:hypothetical protein